MLLACVVPSHCLLSAARGVPTAVEDLLLRLCQVENSVLQPVGEELHTDHLAAWQKKVMQRRKLAYANLSVVTKEQG